MHEASFFSESLGIEKKFYLYLPPQYDSGKRFPVVYLFRGHEREWQDRSQDPTRTQNACDIADSLIAERAIHDLILVMPSTSSDDGSVISCGVNLRSPGLVADRPGVGTGRFGDYLLELVRFVDTHYRTIPTRHARAVDGFSVGGHTALLFGLRHPDWVCSVGAYDASFGFLRKRDPRKGCRTRSDALFDPYPYLYGQPFDQGHFRRHNPADLLLTAGGEQLRAIRGLRFYIQCAGAPEPKSNRDRTLHMLSLLALRGIEVEPPSAILDPAAEHNWKWADEHLTRSLVIHDRAFEKARRKNSEAA
jgi:S-formylglutathione hydrolase FrmB